MNRKIKFRSTVNELIAKFAHLFAFPTGNGAFINGKRLVGHYQIFINANHRTKSFAGLARTIRVVKGEHIHRGFFKS